MIEVFDLTKFFAATNTITYICIYVILRIELPLFVFSKVYCFLLIAVKLNCQTKHLLVVLKLFQPATEMMIPTWPSFVP